MNLSRGKGFPRFWLVHCDTRKLRLVYFRF